MNRTRLAKTAASCVFLQFASLSARADSIANALDFTPSADDVGAQFIDLIAGKEDHATTTVSALAAGLWELNIAALAFGTLLFTYIMVVGTVRTAESGELLGKRWSSTWLPIRFVLVASLMVPLTSGYSVGEHGLIFLAKQGSGIASKVWQRSSDFMTQGGDRAAAEFNNASYQASLDESIRTVWRAEACSEAFRQSYSLSATEFGILSTSNQDGSYTLTWGYRGAGQVLQTTQCGSIRTSAYTPSTTVGQPLQLYDTVGNLQEVAEVAAGNISASKAVITAQANALINAATVLRPTAVKYVTPCGAAGQPACPNAVQIKHDVETAIALACQTYTTIVQPAMAALYGSATGSAQASAGGWAMAGVDYYKIARVQSELAKLSGWMPAVTPPSQNDVDATGVIGPIDSYAMSWQAEVSKKSDSTGTSVGRGIAKYIATELTVDPSNKAHALVQIKNAGDHIMTYSQAAIAAAGVVSMTPGGSTVVSSLSVASKFTPLGGALANLGSGLVYGGWALFACGVTMSVILPMMPFVLWTGSLLGWIIAVVEAIAAAPIWFAAHMHPDGDELTGKGSAGYMIVLEILARPAFMVIGLVASLNLSDFFCRFIGYAFWATVDSVQDDSATGFATILVLLVLYIMLIFTVLRTSFGIIHGLPSTIMRWIGGNAATHDKGEQFGQGASAQLNQGLSKAEAVVAPMVARSLEHRPAKKMPRSTGGGATENSIGDGNA